MDLFQQHMIDCGMEIEQIYSFSIMFNSDELDASAITHHDSRNITSHFYIMDMLWFEDGDIQPFLF